MAYLEQLQAGLRYLGRAGESGRKSLDKVVAPVNGAISEIRGAAAELENLPGVSPEMAARLQRALRLADAAHGTLQPGVAWYRRTPGCAEGPGEQCRAWHAAAGQPFPAIRRAGSPAPRLRRGSR